jgi:hypothetical protein
LIVVPDLGDSVVALGRMAIRSQPFSAAAHDFEAASSAPARPAMSVRKHLQPFAIISLHFDDPGGVGQRFEIAVVAPALLGAHAQYCGLADERAGKPAPGGADLLAGLRQPATRAISGNENWRTNTRQTLQDRPFCDTQS